MPNAIIGVDYSITSPAICVYDGKKKFSFEACKCYNLTSYENIFSKDIKFSFHKGYKSEIQRFHNISEWALKIITSYIDDIKIVGIEGYSMGSKGKVFNIAENTALLKYKLFAAAIPFDTVPPTSVKKMATGKGNANKDVMFEQFIKDTNRDLKKELQPNRKLGSPTTDVIDAFYITKYFLDK
jgi:hypothetical protein